MRNTGAQISIREIDDAEGLNNVSVQRILRERDAPLPIRQIGNAKMYDTASVAKFFLERRERIALHFPKRAKKRRKAA
jgi:hypothetical protein